MADVNSPKDVGQRILQACEAIKWSQAQLAKESKITPASISQFVNGERMPSTPLLRKIAIALNISVDYLLTGEEPQPKAAEQREATVLYRSFKSLGKKEQDFVKKQIEMLKDNSSRKE